MQRSVHTSVASFPIDGAFTIARGSKTKADVVVCEIRQGGFAGFGECVPYARYGESMDSVLAQIAAITPLVEDGLSRQALQEHMSPGAARNAVDCALWDLEAKQQGHSVRHAIFAGEPRPLTTAYTLSLGEADSMERQARANAHRTLLKVKVGTADDEGRIRAVRAGAPDSSIILDANEGWSEENVLRHLAICAEERVELVEQPLAAGKDSMLSRIERRVLVCADESVHHTADLAALRDRYDAINIKLDKTGGLTEALIMKARAQELGFRIMVGCMVGSSLAMAPAVLLAQDVQFVDLDGPLLLATDREPGLVYRNSLVYPPETALWG